jgi:hypothetical protein
MPKKDQQPDELEAYCLFCPAPEEVTTFLEQMGMHLEFQMDAVFPPANAGLAVLPAQFHFGGPAGMSIIYLAGEDSVTEDGEQLPPHKSRFWAYPGADARAFGWITQRLALQWSLTWQSPVSPQAQDACQDVA